MLHLLRRSGRRNDFRAFDESVAEAVVPVRMRIDELTDSPRGARLGPLHRVEHLPREAEIEKRIDEQRLVAVDDEARVAPAPGAIRLEIGVKTVADFLKPLLEAKLRETEVRESHRYSLPSRKTSPASRMAWTMRGAPT